MGIASTGMKSSVEHHSSFFSPSCFRDLGRRAAVTHVISHDLFWLIFSPVESTKALLPEDSRHLLISIVNMGLKVGKAVDDEKQCHLLIMNETDASSSPDSRSRR